MSVKIMSQVFDRYPNGGGEMLLALALADHASDDGTRVYPSIGALAAKTRQSERTVQYQLRRMEDAGWLILVNAGHGGRSLSREYRISTDWINGADFDDLQKGAEIAPFQNGANGEKGAIHNTKGCNPLHPQITVIEPSKNHHWGESVRKRPPPPTTALMAMFLTSQPHPSQPSRAKRLCPMTCSPALRPRPTLASTG